MKTLIAIILASAAITSFAADAVVPAKAAASAPAPAASAPAKKVDAPAKAASATK